MLLGLSIHGLLSHGVTFALLAVVVVCVFVIVRKWRRQYVGAVALRAELQATSVAYSELRAQVHASSVATASGNVVSLTVSPDVAVCDERSGSSGIRSLWIPDVVKLGPHHRSDDREALDRGYGDVSHGVAERGPSVALSRRADSLCEHARTYNGCDLCEEGD